MKVESTRLKILCILAPHFGCWHFGCLRSGIKDVYNFKENKDNPGTLGAHFPCNLTLTLFFYVKRKENLINFLDLVCARYQT